MALKGGSQLITGTAAALTGAIPGVVYAKSLTFIAPTANTKNISVGDSTVDGTDGQPGYFTLEPGKSFTPPSPTDGQPFLVDFTALYAAAESGSQVLQIVYVN